MNYQGGIVHWLTLEGAGKFSVSTKAPLFVLVSPFFFREPNSSKILDISPKTCL